MFAVGVTLNLFEGVIQARRNYQEFKYGKGNQEFGKGVYRVDSRGDDFGAMIPLSASYALWGRGCFSLIGIIIGLLRSQGKALREPYQELRAL